MVNRDFLMGLQCLYMRKGLKGNSLKQLLLRKLLKIKSLFLKTNWEKLKIWVKESPLWMRLMPMVLEMLLEVISGTLLSAFMESQLKRS